MLFSADFLNLILYCMQQLGVTLGVGAETIMLAAYLISMRDGVVDEKETQYAQAIKRVMAFALWFIVISGVGITLLHLMVGEGSTILTSAYLFKWVLIAVAVALTMLRKEAPRSSMVEGLIGGTWYALFLVHILAPVTTWFNLGTLYAVWLVGFVICWEALALKMRDKKWSVPRLPALKKRVPAPDMPHSIPLPPPAAAHPAPPAPLAPAPLPMAAAPSPHITMMPSPPQQAPVGHPDAEPLPAGRVTDTPFLPSVPALQPIPTMPSGTAAPQSAPNVPSIPSMPSAVGTVVQNNGTVSLSPPADMLAPSPAPLNMAINVMPKTKEDIK